MYDLYSQYWETLSKWAGDSIFKQQVTIVGIPFLIQFILGLFFTMSDLGKLLDHMFLTELGRY